MNSCNHTAWFYLSGRERHHLHYGTRTARVVHEMTNPERQYPSMIFFVGRQSKNAALREMFPNNNMRRGKANGLVNLWLDSSTYDSDTPLLFAEADPLARVPERLGGSMCHTYTTLPLPRPLEKDQDIVQLLYARLVALFSNVICIFAEDLGGLDGVATFLSDWIKIGEVSTLPPSVRPRVVIVLREADIPVTQSVLELEEFRMRFQQENEEARAKVFSSMSLIHLAGDRMSSLAQHRRLMEVLLSEIGSSQIKRKELRLQFSAVHVEAFFTCAIQSLSKSINIPFDFVRSARSHNEVEDDYRDHIMTFTSLNVENFSSYGSLTSFIASSILMDAYPPRMHAFDPRYVFQELYKGHCFQAIQQALNSPMFAEDLCTCIEDQIDLFFPAIDLGFETSVQLHTNNVKSSSLRWNLLKSHSTCLFCLRRRPEHVLTCEHAICDVCVMIFGHRVQGKDGYREVDNCILCVTRGKLLTRLKPATAGARILSVDGGGVRGVVPLEFLGLLQEQIGSDLQVQDLFEQAFGTSSGGLIVLGLFLNHWDVFRCAQIFDSLIRNFFGIHMTKGSGTLNRLRGYLRCWLSDGCYDIELLERSLKEIFGSNRRLFDADTAGVSGQKVAVTATTLSDASTYIFSNYNGRPRNRSCGYKHIRADQIQNEPFIWEAGRVTSAAPGLFKPAFITSLGSFQDGGLRHNNPVDLALWECPKLWSSNTSPDVVLSLGTGTDKDLRSPRASNFRHILNDGFIPRLYRSFMSSIDGERSWRDLTNRLDDEAKDDFFRLNIPFTGDEPRLDDVQCVDGLRQSVRLQPQGAKDRADVTFALLVASFYFELDAIPVFEANRYYCTGVIRCRNDAHGVLQLLGRLHDGLEFATDAESLGELTIKDVCPRCHIYCKKVNFSVRYLDDVISMKLKIPDRLQRKISGFPHSMTWFIAQQHLDASFGEAAHDSSLRDRCGVCEVFDATGSRVEKPEAVRPPSTETRLCTSRIRQKRKIDDLSGTGCSHKYKRLRLKTSS